VLPKIVPYFPWLAYDDETKLFLLDGNYIGFGFTMLPLSGFEPTLEARFHAILNYEYPANTLLQWNLLVMDDVDQHLADLATARAQSTDPLIRQTANSTIQFLKDASRGIGMDVPVRNSTLLFTVKMPISDMLPTDEERLNGERIRKEVLETLQAIGFQETREMSDAELVYRLSMIVNRGDAAAWRDGRFQPDPAEFLRDQIFDYDNGVKVQKKHLEIGPSIVTSLSVKKFPPFAHFGLARRYSSNPMSGDGGIPCSHMITSTILIQDIVDQKPKLELRRQAMTFNANGQFGRLVPEYKRRAEDLERLTKQITDGEFVHRVSVTVTLFNNSLETARRNNMRVRTYLNGLGLTFLEDAYINLPLFRSNLPLGAELPDEKALGRLHTMNSEGLATFLPIFFEWRGTVTPLISLVGRGGQLMAYSPFDTQTNYNMTISAESGAGKSFITNELIAAILGTGGKVWVIDVGRSYVKLCESLNGQFLSFDRDSKICLNPFSSIMTIEEFEDVQDILFHLLATMAAPDHGLTDYQNAELRRILREQFEAHGSNLSIDLIAQACIDEAKEQEDGGFKEKRISDVGRGLQAFCSTGQYGKYFTGPSNIDFSKSFVLLELDELKSQKLLQTIVLLLLIYQISQGMYLGDLSIKKLMVVDEAWDLLSEPRIARFIEAGYRRFRKYNGSACIITQSLADLHGTDTGKAILANSASYLMLRQKPATIRKLSDGPEAELDTDTARILETVNTVPGRYAELYLNTPYGKGVGRFMVDPLRALLYSTNPNDVSAIKRFRDQGMDVLDAINAVLTARGKARLDPGRTPSTKA